MMKSLTGFEPSRSALDDIAQHTIASQPSVAAIIPVYNERMYIDAVIESICAQDYPQLTEIWIVDGHSDDGTFEHLQNLVVGDARLRLLTNPRRTQASSINLALTQAHADIIIRLDAHAQYAKDIISQSVRTLLETGAGGVGAIARPIPAHTLIGKSIVAAHRSNLGVGVASFRREIAEGRWVDTVWNGCYWWHVLKAAGPLREDLPRNEDNEFNARVRSLGYGLFLSPAIRAYYQPRQTFTALWQQQYATGMSIAETLLETPEAIGIRHLVPGAFVASLLGSAVMALVWRPARFLFLAVVAPYLIATILFSLIEWRRQPGRYAVLLPLTFAILHFSYGFGTLRGFLQIISKRSHV